MAIRRNGLYDDSALKQAFSNLADIFSPPSGADLAGYANAKATREKAARLTELYDYARNPGYDQTTADRMGVLGGLYAPNQSYHAVDQNDATTRRGQDINAQTSRANNTADNARAIETNTADNQRAFAQTRYGAVSKDALLPALPQSVADMYNIPSSDVVQGNISLAPGETVVTPTGQQLAGTPKPLSDAEVKGAILQQLPASDQRSVAMQGVPVEQILDPTTNKPRFATRQDAVSTGAEPFIKATPSELSTLQAERDRLPADDPRRKEYDARIQALGRGQQQGAYDKSNDEDLSKLNTDIFNNGKTALADQHTYSTVLAAVNNPNVDQGAMANATLTMRKYLNAFGVNAGDTGPAEMLNALGNQIALKLRDPSNGAGMPGSMSDSDREFLRSMSVSLGNSPQANALLAKYYIAVQQRSIDLNDLRQKYVNDHGRLDEGFRTTMADYLRSNDPTQGIKNQLAGGDPATAAAATVTPNAANAPAAPAATPSGGAIEQWDFVNGKLQRVK